MWTAARAAVVLEMFRPEGGSGGGGCESGKVVGSRTSGLLLLTTD